MSQAEIEAAALLQQQQNQNAPPPLMHPPPPAGQGAPLNGDQQTLAPAAAPTSAANDQIQPGAQVGQLNQQAGFDMAAFMQMQRQMNEDMERRMQQHMQLQMDLMERKMSHMVQTFNDVMGQVATAPVVPNAPGWPLTSATTPTTATLPAPGSATAAPHNSATTPPQVLGAGAALSALNPPAAFGPQTNAAIGTVTQALSTNAAVSSTNMLTAVNTPGSHTASSAQVGAATLGNINGPQGTGGGLTGVPSHFSLPPPNYRITAPAQAVSGPIMSSHYTQPFGQQQAIPTTSTTQIPATASRTQAGERNDDGYDSSDSQYCGVSRRRPSHARRGRGTAAVARATERHNLRTLDREQVQVINQEQYDPNDGYALNREREETKSCKSLHIKNFSSTNKEQDFSIWVKQFQEAVNKALNPHTKRKHDTLCLQWISNSLESDAFAIYNRSEHQMSDWTKLKKELEQAFEDPAIRADWKTNLRAYTWDEKIPLQAYAAKVKHYVDIFETEMAECPAAIKSQYYLRFVNGLPEDYFDQVRLNIPTNSTSIDKALDICIRWQGSKRSKSKPQTEEAAAVTFEDQTVPARMTKMEADMKKLMNKLDNKDSDSSTTQDFSRVHLAGRSPHPQAKNNYQPYNKSGYSPHRSSNNGYSSNQDKYQHQSRTADRLKRLSDRRNNRQRSFSGHKQQNNSSHGQHYNQKNRPKQDDEEGLACEVEADEDKGQPGMNDTIYRYEQFKEEEDNQKFLKFCAAEEQLKAGN